MSDLEALKKAITESPENVPLLLLYGQSCLDGFSLDEARSAFEGALALRPENAEAKLGIARVLFLDGHTSEAVVRAQCVLQEQPGFAPAHVFLSRLYLSEQEHEEAMAHYRKALVINKGMSDPALEKALAAVQGNASASAGAAEGQQRLSATTEAQWQTSSDDGRRGGDEFDDDPAAFFEDLDGYEDGERPNANFTLQDFPRPEANFAAVGGLVDLKEEIRMKVVYPLRHPDLFRAYGKKAGGSVLLYGPPGCGKTLTARGIAGESSAQFFEIGLHHILESYVGGSERNLHQIFELARQNAPSVIFIDELDALAADRASQGQNFNRTLINQLLHELDMDDPGGVFVIGTTSAPWNLDEAFLRPGRFDRRILVPLPDFETRRQILEVLTRDKPILDLELDELTRETPGFSGADLQALVDVATESALALAMKEDCIVPLTMEMLLEGTRLLRPSASGWDRRFRKMEGRGL